MSFGFLYSLFFGLEVVEEAEAGEDEYGGCLGGEDAYGCPVAYAGGSGMIGRIGSVGSWSAWRWLCGEELLRVSFIWVVKLATDEGRKRLVCSYSGRPSSSL